jgi:DNA-binding SARP family transcriptional activator
MLEFRILGPLEAVGEDGPIQLGGPRQRATLAILLLSANRVVPVDRIADELYAGAAPVTAVTQVQRQISELRKAFGDASAIETVPPGYLIRLSPGQLDLLRFERLTQDAEQALARGDPEVAVDLFREALGLWRGSPLADLTYESFAQAPVSRLEGMRLAVLEQRFEAEFSLGRHSELIPELEELVVAYPLRERFQGQLMLALYRAGRQAEALDVYRAARESLVGEFGIEPTPVLRDLERAILGQDASLELTGDRQTHTEPDRSLLVLSSSEEGLEQLLTIAEPLAKLPGRELILARLLEGSTQLADKASAVSARRASLTGRVRTAVFTTLDVASDTVRLATSYEVELVLLHSASSLGDGGLQDDLIAILEHSPADVALLEGAVDWGVGNGVFVPFSGGKHDWAALELAASLALAADAPLRLVGTEADPQRGERDASRLLADASLAVQRVVGIETAPLLAQPTEDALVAAVDDSTLVVVGISPRWRQEGIGATRSALVRSGRPIVFVHCGPRPGGLSPRETRTRFTWTIEPTH